MLILPFLLAGVVMLGVLNPRFTVTLFQQTIFKAGSLLIDAPRRRAASQYLLAHVPWTSTHHFWHSSDTYRTLPAASPEISFEPPSDRTCPFQTASSSWATTCCQAVSMAMPTSSRLAAQVLVFFLLAILLRRVYIGLVRYYGSLVLSSPRVEPIDEELRKQVYDQISTSGSPQQPHSSCGYHTSRNALSSAYRIANTSFDVGLGAISGTPLALPPLVREIDDDASVMALQPTKEAPMKVLPASQTTRIDGLGCIPESVRAFRERKRSRIHRLADEKGSTFLPKATIPK